MLVRLDSLGNPVVLLASNSTPQDGAGNRVTQQNAVTKAVEATEPIVESSFGLTHGGGFDFYVAKYASNGPMQWATFVGAEGDELIDAAGLAIRADDAVVIAGATSSIRFAEAGAWDPTFNGAVGTSIFGADCAIALFDADATSLDAATYYGGVGGEGCTGVASDSSLRIYVTGGTTSVDLPIKAGPHQTQRPGPRSAFLAIFGADLGTLLYSGYFGGTGLGHANALELRPPDTATSGRVVFGGESEAGYPLTPAPGTPARGTVTAPPPHGVVSEATLGF
jgi:hypothetical protein